MASGFFSLCGAGNGNRSPKETPSRPTAPGQPGVGPAKTFKFSKTLRDSRFSRTITESLFFKRIYSTRSDSSTIGTEREGKKYPLPVLFPGPIGSDQLNAGDVIVCRQQHFLRSRRTHWFFAINRYEVLHVHRPENFHGVANIRGDRWVRLPDRFKYIDFQHCKNLGNRGYQIEVTVERAMRWQSKVVFYDRDSCSSYHWVIYWATGQPPKPRLSLLKGFSEPMPKDCRLKTVVECPYPDPWVIDKYQMNLERVPNPEKKHNSYTWTSQSYQP